MDNLSRHVLIVAAVLALVVGAGLATQAAGSTARAPAATHLVLNEVDYDNVGTDDHEFVEVYNGTGASVDLADMAVVLVNGGTGTEYARVALGPNCLAADQYLVVMDPAVVPAPGAISIPFPGADNQIQNGAPDGVALIDTASLTLVDALSYEGSITSAQIDGFPAPVSLVEGSPTPIVDSNVNQGSLDREPNGADTDNAEADWAFDTTPTPGASNAGAGMTGRRAGPADCGPPPPPPPPPPPAPPPPPPESCRVPNVIGLFLARAKARIRAANCSVGRISWKRSRWEGRVIRQHPQAGRERPAGWKVRLVVGR